MYVYVGSRSGMPFIGEGALFDDVGGGASLIETEDIIFVIFMRNIFWKTECAGH